jgi:hypothetical protein
MRILRRLLVMMVMATAAQAQIRLPSLPLPGLPLKNLPQTLDQT